MRSREYTTTLLCVTLRSALRWEVEFDPRRFEGIWWNDNIGAEDYKKNNYELSFTESNRKPRRCWKKKSGVRARLDSWSWRITPKYIQGKVVPGLPARFQYCCFSSSKVWLCVCSYLRCSTKTTKFINFNKRLGFETYKCLRKQKAIRFCFGRHTEYTTMTKEV